MWLFFMEIGYHKYEIKSIFILKKTKFLFSDADRAKMALNF